MNPQESAPDGAPVSPPPTPTDTGEGLPEFSTLAPSVQDYIRGLRREAKKSREEKKAAEREAQDAETRRLENEKQWETLAQQRADKLKELEPKAAEAEEMRQFLSQQLDRRLAAIPQQWRDAVPEYDDPRRVLDWLDKNEAKLRLPSLPPQAGGLQGNGAGATGAQKKPMSPEFLAIARKMGRTVAQAQASWDANNNAE